MDGNNNTMRCQDITYENHKVEAWGFSMSSAMLAGLVGLTWVQVDGYSLLRGRMESRELFEAVMADPEHRFHPVPCTCGTIEG
jgi:hypothetical protein